jgi:polar amino acid transport system substrate-binding protein
VRYFKTLIVLCILLVGVVPVNAQDPIQLYYYERTPYAVADNQGDVSGLCASPAAAAFEQAGIPFQWKRMPFKRQLATIKHNKKKACGIGWFKNPEREQFARFTDPIYQDKPAVTLSKNGNQALKRYSDLKSLIKDKGVKLLVKDGFSYGAYIDGLIEKYDPEVVVATGTNIQMLQMLLAERADYFFTSEEEAEHMIQSAGFSVSQFQLQRYRDMPPGNNRYITCSEQVSPETIELLNRALK